MQDSQFVQALVKTQPCLPVDHEGGFYKLTDLRQQSTQLGQGRAVAVRAHARRLEQKTLPAWRRFTLAQAVGGQHHRETHAKARCRLAQAFQPGTGLGAGEHDAVQGPLIAPRFSETDARVMGRTAKGVRGMRVTLAAAQAEDDVETDTDSDDEESSDLNVASRIVSLVVVPETGEVLCASANGYGKRTPVDDFPTKKRGGKGVIAIKTSERNGELVGAVAIDESKELMLISDGGTLVRTRASEVARTGRNAQGVRLIRLGNEEILVGVVAVEAVEVEDDILDASMETTEETVVDEVNVDASENTTDTNTSNED